MGEEYSISVRKPEGKRELGTICLIEKLISKYFLDK
jgi:hypothetical protein